MQDLSIFYGIRVTMHYDESKQGLPPHFQAEYIEDKALIEISNAKLIQGSLPDRQLKLILAWCVIHQDELIQNWELAKDGKLLFRIPPLT